MEGLVREGVDRPRSLELLERAVAARDAVEADAIDVTQRRTRLGREVGVVERPSVFVELHEAALGADVHERGEEARAADAHRPSGKLRRDRGKPVLLTDPVLPM